MAIDLKLLQEYYFTYGLPVPYELKSKEILYITPVKLKDSAMFMSSCGVLDIDKNSSNDVKDIQMSYLQYLVTKVLKDPICQQQFINLCILCLGFKRPFFAPDERGRPVLGDLDIETKQGRMAITTKEFEDVRRIILYQNILHYDDEYVNPELKQAMMEQDMLKSKGMKAPNTERRIQIIAAHSGIPMSRQLDMTYREHTALFEEVRDEVEYLATKSIACYGGKGSEVQWIYKTPKGKYDEYITSVEDFNKSMGGDGNVPVATGVKQDNI